MCLAALLLMASPEPLLLCIQPVGDIMWRVLRYALVGVENAAYYGGEQQCLASMILIAPDPPRSVS